MKVELTHKDTVLIEITKEEAKDYLAVIGSCSANDFNRLFAKHAQNNPEYWAKHPQERVRHDHCLFRLYQAMAMLIGVI